MPTSDIPGKLDVEATGYPKNGQQHKFMCVSVHRNWLRKRRTKDEKKKRKNQKNFNFRCYQMHAAQRGEAAAPGDQGMDSRCKAECSRPKIEDEDETANAV